MGMIHCRYCLPLRSNLSFITLVEGNSGRENLKPLNEPQIKTERRWQDMISLTLGPFLAGSGENQRIRCPREGLGKQVLVQDNVLTRNNLRSG